ncbi:MAG: radical SAM protein [Gemmatimonadetes bacterium]|nr:radical SAM protein [Gemmatimonadota bacterium]
MGIALAKLLDGAGATRETPGRYVPHVVAWNLTRRCNLECAHCYISAGPEESAASELTGEEFRRIAEEILALNPAPLFILSGGEPLLRADLPELARFATERGATVVVGTNGTLLTDERITELKDAGVTGVAVSVDSLEPKHHDNFRHGAGSLAATIAALERLRRHRLDFVIQTTVTKKSRTELGRLVQWAAEHGAVCFNAYFLVATGRGARLSDLSPDEYEAALAELVAHTQTYLGRMMVRAKCAPHFMRHVHRDTPDSPVLNYQTRCPCGTQYCRITPDGKLTPCPYIPVPAGDLRRQAFNEVWQRAELFQALRSGQLGGKCGRCEYRELCGGCRARALAVQGDVLAEDPSCAYQPGPMAEPIRPPRAVTYGAAVEPELRWAPDAAERLKRIPSFVRGVVVQRLEAYARRQGATEVTLELMREVRRAMPIDFSKRLPFFASAVPTAEAENAAPDVRQDELERRQR